MTDQELLAGIRECRPADLADAMDALGLVNTGTMSSAMRPLRPGIRMAGFAYTVKLVPAQEDVRVCDTIEEYWQDLGRWCEETYAFTAGLTEGKGKDKVVVVDMDGYPGGLWGSDIGMSSLKWGVAGVVLDGACRDSYECNLERLKVWCTTRTFNHVYGRLRSAGIEVPIQCAGVAVRPGDVVCGDDDGVLVIPRERADKVLAFARAIHQSDQKSRAKHYKDLGFAPDESLGEFGRQ